MKKMQRKLKIDRRTLMKNEVPVKKTVYERLLAKEKVLDEKKVLVYQVKISRLPVGDDDRTYYAVDPENLIVQQKAQLLKQDGLMRDMRMEFNTQRTTLEKQVIIIRERSHDMLAELKRRWRRERFYFICVTAALCMTIFLMIVL